MSGELVVKYEYDAWGNIISETNASGGTLTGNAAIWNEINPFRYRGYYYDAETGLYYLQSRYYDAETGRFINQDSYISTGTGLLGFNMFAYCDNNPVNGWDPTGEAMFECCPHGDCASCKAKKKEESSFLKKLFSQLSSPKKDGNTFSAGFTGGYTSGGSSAGKTYVLSSDSSHNYAFQQTESIGVSTGVGASVGIVFTFTDASDVQDLVGKSISRGFSLVAKCGISIDYIEFNPASNPSKTCKGINVVISIGGELELHSMDNYTESTESWNPFIYLQQLF